MARQHTKQDTTVKIRKVMRCSSPITNTISLREYLGHNINDSRIFIYNVELFNWLPETCAICSWCVARSGCQSNLTGQNRYFKIACEDNDSMRHDSGNTGNVFSPNKQMLTKYLLLTAFTEKYSNSVPKT